MLILTCKELIHSNINTMLLFVSIFHVWVYVHHLILMSIKFSRCELIHVILGKSTVINTKKHIFISYR